MENHLCYNPLGVRNLPWNEEFLTICDLSFINVYRPCIKKVFRQSAKKSLRTKRYVFPFFLIKYVFPQYTFKSVSKEVRRWLRLPLILFFYFSFMKKIKDVVIPKTYYFQQVNTIIPVLQHRCELFIFKYFLENINYQSQRNFLFLLFFFLKDLWKRLYVVLISPSAKICKNNVRYQKAICSRLYQEISLYLVNSYIKISLALLALYLEFLCYWFA